MGDQDYGVLGICADIVRCNKLHACIHFEDRGPMRPCVGFGCVGAYFQPVYAVALLT